MNIGHEDPFYPFRVIYHLRNSQGISPETGYPCWLGYRDNWLDGQIHWVEKRDEKWISIDGSIYDGVYDNSKHRETECSPNERMAYPAEPYTAIYKKIGDKLFCPNGHGAGGYYIGCRDYGCVFHYQRQGRYKHPIYEKDAVPMKIVIEEQS